MESQYNGKILGAVIVMCFETRSVSDVLQKLVICFLTSRLFCFGIHLLPFYGIVIFLQCNM